MATRSNHRVQKRAKVGGKLDRPLDGHAEPGPFADLLQHHRRAAGLTQEELAERAHLSVRGSSNLERDVRRLPQRGTVTLLIAALALEGPERAAFEVAAIKHAYRCVLVAQVLWSCARRAPSALPAGAIV